jgi:spoIIIJ-associated protein
MEESIAYAKKYLEDLLSFFGLNTDVHATYEEEVIELSVPSTHMNGFLIGQRGETMRALQFMVSNALRNNEYQYTRVNIDIAEYKKHRADEIAERALGWVEKVKTSGEQFELRPMSPADRRIVHKVAGEHGLETESVGEGHDRHIILKPNANAVVEEAEPEAKPETKPEKE